VTCACLLIAMVPAMSQPDVTTLTLDIPSKRISQERLDESLAVDVGGPGAGIDLSVGASIAAGRVHIELRRIDGAVRYRLRADKVTRPIQDRVRTRGGER
jgi:hypothetical protein